MATHSSFSSIATDLSDDSSLCVEAGNQSEADERMSTSYLDGLAPIDDSVQTAAPEKGNGSLIICASNCGFEGTHVGVPNLSTIP